MASPGLAQNDRDFYRENGYLLVSGVFGPEDMTRMRQETEDLLDRANSSGRNTDATWQGEWRNSAAGNGPAVAPATRIDSIHNVQNHSAFFTRLLVDPRLTDLAAGLIGPNIQLHHTKLHAKPPAIGSPFPVHQ